MMIGLVVLASLLLSPPADPCAAAVCRCVPLATTEALERADAVFAGTVVSVDSADDALTRGMRYTVRLRVDAAWKGAADTEMTFVAGSTSCDLRYEPGVRYVIFGLRDDGRMLQGGMCTGTRREPDAEYLDPLGPPRT